ncbi:MAG: Flp pilus assembly complex ATPase component TadA [Verrucomicrobiales bacterium]|nr:Flp pilus assembly complex ATPase component TadA [Verrucomicrobiales bacterium]
MTAPQSNSRPTADAIPSDPDAAPEVLAQLVHEAEADGASDLHLQVGPNGADLSLRLDGVLVPWRTVPGELGRRLLGRIKYLAKLQTYQDALPQDGRIERADLGARCDVRVATHPTVSGERAVLRLFRDSEAPTLEDSGHEPEVLSALMDFLRQPAGLLLLTGPAGSGKTTTIYACLERIRSLGGRHIITLEDPVEQVLPGIMQTEVDEARGLTYAAATRHLLRQDPQVLALGEIRDDETAALAVRAALTGHLVLSTLHAGSCRGVLDRLRGMVPDATALAASPTLILNQRLVRRTCTECSGRGCDRCVGTGYRGRLPLTEFLRCDDAVRSSIRRGDVSGLEPERPLRVVAEELCKRGLTTPGECQRVLGS